MFSPQTWLEIEFPDPLTISVVYIYRRATCCPDRERNLKVRIGDTSAAGTGNTPLAINTVNNM